MTQSSRMPPRALLLGYAGLVPFIGLSLGLWWLPLSWQSIVGEALLAYSAVILSFMGAIHWSVAMQWPQAEQHYSYSVMLALLAWILLLLPATVALIGYIAGFSLALGLDRRAWQQGWLPAWYGYLRWPLSVAVCICLLVAIAAPAGT